MTSSFQAHTQCGGAGVEFHIAYLLFLFYFILLRGFSKAGVPFPLYFVLLTQRPVDPVLASRALHLCLPDKGLKASQLVLLLEVPEKPPEVGLGA